MNNLETLTMVSMETKVVSRDSFLDKLSEKRHLNGFWDGFFLGGTMCPPPLVFGTQKKLGWDRVDVPVFELMGPTLYPVGKKVGVQLMLGFQISFLRVEKPKSIHLR